MCLAIPAKISKLLTDDYAIVTIGGIEKKVCIALLDEISVDDYVIIHVGYALTRLDEDEAKKTLTLFDQMQQKGLVE